MKQPLGTFGFMLWLEVEPTDPRYRMLADHRHAVTIVDDGYGEPDGECSMERLTLESFAEQIASRVVGHDFDGMWRIKAAWPGEVL